MIPWDFVLNTLKAMGFNAMAGFVEFYKNREHILANFSEEQRTLANIGKYQAELFDKYAPHTDSMVKELIKFGPEYLASVVPGSAINGIYDYFITLGRNLEIKREMQNRSIPQQLLQHGEFRRIARL
jgi:hypothetical protein